MRCFCRTPQAGYHKSALQTFVSRYSSRGGGLRVTAKVRQPQLGSVTIVGREEVVTRPPCFATAVPTRRPPTTAARLMHRLGLHPKPVLFDGHGVPVDGSFVALPASERIRLLVAMLAAFVATKAAYDVVRYECTYNNLWNTNWRYSADPWHRTQYYAGFTAGTMGLSALYALTFLASATVAGRNRLASRMLCRSAARILPHATTMKLARRLHV